LKDSCPKTIGKKLVGWCIKFGYVLVLEKTNDFPLKIALLPSAYYPSLGGVEELSRQLAIDLRRKGHEVIVITNRWPRDLPEFERRDGIDIHRLPMRSPGAGLKSEISYRLTRRSIKTNVARIVRDFSADVVHVQCVSPSASYAIAAARTCNVPLVVTLQGELTMDATGLYQRSVWAQKLFRRTLNAASMVTACSRQTLDEAEQFLGHPWKSEAIVIHNGVHAQELSSAKPYKHTGPYILAIGRHVPQKGFDVLLNAYALGRKQMDLPDLIIAGDGPESEKLSSLSDALCLSKYVHFVGRADRPLAASFFKGCEFFVLPSRHEPFGIVNLEAMAAGKAIIATKVGGVPEIVENDVNGLLVPPKNAMELSMAIQKLWTDRELAIRLGERGQRRSADSDWSHVAAKYVHVYQQVTNSLSHLKG